MTQHRSWHQDKQKRQKWLTYLQSLNPDVGPQALRLMDEMGFVARTIFHIGEQSVEQAGLSLAQYRVLMHLSFAENVGDRGELNPSEISERQGVSRNTVSSLIRNLEEEGLVERSIDPDDRRRFNIRLTAGGRALVNQHVRQHLATVDRCFSALSPAEQQTLYDLLHKVGSHATAVRGQP